MGLLDGLFGKKSTESEGEVEVGNGKGAYFLEQDDAKSMGNIEYMRKAKTVKKTFPGIAGREGFETVETISNMEKLKDGQPVASQNKNGVSSNGFKPAAQTDESKTVSNETSERRRSDSSMDMFRNMARDIKKKD
jgi:hypothetical protein